MLKRLHLEGENAAQPRRRACEMRTKRETPPTSAVV